MDMNEFGGEEVKNIERYSFFRFDKLYFPVLARLLFIILCAAVVVFGLIFVILGFVGFFTNGFWYGLGVIVGAVIYMALTVFFLRIWFELILVVFNMNDALQEIKVNTRK